MVDCVCCWQDDPMTNLNTAFDVAEKYLDIPKMLDAEGEQTGRKIVEMMMRRTDFFLCSKTKIYSLRSAVLTAWKWWKAPLRTWMWAAPVSRAAPSASPPLLDRCAQVWTFLTFLLAVHYFTCLLLNHTGCLSWQCWEVISFQKADMSRTKNGQNVDEVLNNRPERKWADRMTDFPFSTTFFVAFY